MTHIAVLNSPNDSSMTAGRASRLQGLDAFLATVETGSFAAAGNRLGLTRSAVAKAVAKLEDHLGVPLLFRSTRRIRVTAEGLAFHAEATRAMAALDAAEARAAGRHGQLAGRLTISLPVSFGRRWLLAPLLDLRNRHPDLALSVTFTDRYVRPIEEGVDLAVRIGAPRNETGLESRELTLERPVICAAAAYLACAPRLARLDDLARHRCVLFAREDGAAPWRLLSAKGGTVEITPPEAVALGDGEAMVEAVAAGLGPALLPDWLIADHVARGEIVTALSEPRPAVRPIRLVWPERLTGHPRLAAGSAALEARFADGVPWDVRPRPADQRRDDA